MRAKLAIGLGFLFLSCLLIPTPSFAQTQKTFQSKYTTIHFTDDKDLDDFIWRLGGERMEFAHDPQLASYRIDRLVDRVQAILDMWPRNFHVHFFLTREPLSVNEVAFYDKKKRAIHVRVDYASDGVVAHELAHATMEQFFPTPPPSKVQEILAQYVDGHLWNDY